jgi:hypothetical protein
MEEQSTRFFYLLALPLDIIIHEIFWYFKRPQDLRTVFYLHTAGLYRLSRQEGIDGYDHPRTLISDWLKKTKGKLILQSVIACFNQSNRVSMSYIGKLYFFIPEYFRDDTKTILEWN